MNVFKANFSLTILLCLSMVSWTFSIDVLKHFFCVPADQNHFHMLKNLIGSIHHNDSEHLGEIAVFNLGFTAEQIAELLRMKNVKVYAVEMTNPDLLTPLLTHPAGRKVRGFFAWKPVVIKQALDMFPYVLYLDAGTTVLKPLDRLFEYINEHGYFLLSCTRNETCRVGNRITKTVCDKLIARLPKKESDMIMSSAYFIDAGLQGLTRRMLAAYVLPVYNYTHDLTLFADDGTAKFGFGAARHDQTLFTIQAYCLGLKIHPEGTTGLDIKGKLFKIHTHWDGSEVNNETIIYRSRDDVNFRGGMTRFICFNEKN